LCFGIAKALAAFLAFLICGLMMTKGAPTPSSQSQHIHRGPHIFIEAREGFDYTGADAKVWLTEAGFHVIRVEHVAGRSG